MSRLIILGASGQGKVVVDIAVKSGYDDIVFLDDNERITSCLGFDVVGSIDLLPQLEGDVFVAIGNKEIRKELMEKNTDRTFPNIIHPRAIVADEVKLGEGTAIMAGAIINPGVTIGKGCIVNTASSIDHDSVIGDYCHISVGAHICGTVNVGEETWIGAGVIVSNNINICDNVIIGAGAVIVNDINESGTYVGVPAIKIKSREKNGGGNDLLKILSSGCVNVHAEQLRRAA